MVSIAPQSIGPELKLVKQAIYNVIDDNLSDKSTIWYLSCCGVPGETHDLKQGAVKHGR